MLPPKNIQPFETDLSTMWFDEDGMFYSITKPNSKLNKEGLKQSFEYILNNKKHDKICWLGDVTNAGPAEKEARKYSAEETPKFVKALALITNSALSKMIAELYLMVAKPPYPTKMFTDEQEAKEWLKKHLEINQTP
jgi:hypothetical protein